MRRDTSTVIDETNTKKLITNHILRDCNMYFCVPKSKKIIHL